MKYMEYMELKTGYRKFNMKAFLLAAGFGTRLRPLTNTVPKCLVPISGTPLLEIWLDLLIHLGKQLARHKFGSE
ncbi:sugar phosphate nucleotidyltransferase [Cloacibacillus sp.]